MEITLMTLLTKKELYASGKYEFGSLTDEDVARINGQVAYETQGATGKVPPAKVPVTRAAASHESSCYSSPYPSFPAAHV